MILILKMNPPKKMRKLNNGEEQKKVSDTENSPMIDSYKAVLKTALSSNTISVEKKRFLRQFREDHKISNEEHNMALGYLGWTSGEYEDGERIIIFELEEEREIFMDDNGFKILTLYPGQSMTKEQENIWSIATSKYYQTMSVAQGNYEIESIGVIINTRSQKKFEKQRNKLKILNPEYGEEKWGFHGTSVASISSIAQGGFKAPEELKKDKKVKILDEGYFGKGMYFSIYSD